jgi:hypothetical protein
LDELELTTHARTGSLSCCHGFEVAAGDGPVGRVETPIFSGTSLEPHSLLLRTIKTIPGTFAAVAADRVVSVDESAKRIRLDGTLDELFGADAVPVGGSVAVGRRGGDAGSGDARSGTTDH